MVWHPQQKIETGEGGEAILELPAESLREARRFILAYGKHATALSPPELVEDLRAELSAMTGLYGAAEKTTPAAGTRNKRQGSARSR